MLKLLSDTDQSIITESTFFCRLVLFAFKMLLGSIKSRTTVLVTVLKKLLAKSVAVEFM